MKKLGARVCGLAVLASVIAVGWTTPGVAQQSTANAISLRDTFPVGSNGLCEAQIVASDEGAGLFDRKYSIICRDASAPVGTLWAVRGDETGNATERFASPEATCNVAAQTANVGGLNGTRQLVCQTDASPIRTQLIVGQSGNRTYAASGLTAYQSALVLGLETLARDRVVEGEVDIPLTQTTDALAFARQQAAAISADQALSEAYRRSNSGEYAEAAEFFAASADTLSGNSAVEAKLNAALQQSNLGNYSEASRIFEEVRPSTSNSPVLARLQRNYEVIDALNQREVEIAIDILDRPLPRRTDDADALRNLVIGSALAERLSAEAGAGVGTFTEAALTPLEREQLLDGQADYLRATALRLQGNVSEAAQMLEQAEKSMSEVRGGRVVSISWLRAQVLDELAQLAERSGDISRSENLHLRAVNLLSRSYPGAPILQSSRAQLAGFYARNNRRDEALSIYRDIVADAEGRPLPTIRSLMTPYFDLLLSGEDNAAAAADIFSASQLLQRPGLAQTQAVLARELSGGSDEASLLFRKTTNVGRSIERLRVEIADLEVRAEVDPLAAQALLQSRAKLEALQLQQAEILEKLAEFPKYRAVSDSSVDLTGLQSVLRDGEAYLKLITLGEETFVLFATSQDAIAYQAEASPDELEFLVGGIRDSIAIAEGGAVTTLPFDIESSRELFVQLFEPIKDQLTAQKHIVFEPDGAMLKLPLNLLVTDDESVENYFARLDSEGGDSYDFTGTSWLGRGAEISTSVSPAAFRDVRRSRPSAGEKAYLGLGENLPLEGQTAGRARTRSALAGGEDCLWSPSIWANPISSAELYDAAARLDGPTTVLTKGEFTDAAIKEREDLSEYRVLHFATHGLVTAPQDGCPPRPALLTSLGEGGSDGLLSFAEIFALRIDADLVILSACDTAGSATVGATREAGITSGGDFALDGLVRAFVGAGGRTVLASHWPVPDDFDATQRLISGLFADNAGSTAQALRKSQLALMDDLNTSHPFYWSAFAIVGDGTVTATR